MTTDERNVKKKGVWDYLKPYLWVLAFSPVFMMGEVIMDLFQPQLMSRVIDDGVLGLSNGGVSQMDIVLSQGGRMVLFTVIGGVCGILCGVTSKYGVTKFSNDMRKDCFQRILSLSFAQIDDFTTGSLITRLTNDMMQIQNLVGTLVSTVVRNLTYLIGGMVCLFLLDRRFGLAALAAMPVIFLLVIAVIRLTNPLFSRLQKQLDHVNGVMQEDVEGIRVIKAFVKEDYEEKRFQDANNEMLDTQLRVLLILSYLNPAMNLVMNLTAVGIIWAGNIEVRAGLASPGNIIAAVTYISQILNGVMSIVVLFQSASRGGCFIPPDPGGSLLRA